MTKTVKQARNRVAAVEQDYKALSGRSGVSAMTCRFLLYRGDPRRR